MAARATQRAIIVHPGPYRCVVSGCRAEAVYGENFSLSRHGKLAFGTGYRLRSANEPFLLATNGSPKTALDVRSVVEGPLREHSRKPDEAYREAERVIAPHTAPHPPRLLDLFSREARPGWQAWGNEAGKFNDKEPADA